MQCNSNENPKRFFFLEIDALVLKCIWKFRVKNSQDNLEEEQSGRTYCTRYQDFDDKVAVMKTAWSGHNDR